MFNLKNGGVICKIVYLRVICRTAATKELEVRMKQGNSEQIFIKMEKGTTIDQIGKEIERYLNENKYSVIYHYINAGATNEESGITELSFSVQHVNKIDTIIIEYSFPQEGGSRFLGHVFHLNLKELPTKLNESIIKWVNEDITRAQKELMKH